MLPMYVLFWRCEGVSLIPHVERVPIIVLHLQAGVVRVWVIFQMYLLTMSIVVADVPTFDITFVFIPTALRV